MRESLSYDVHIDAPADDTLCRCAGCDQTFKFSELHDIEDCSLTPGDASPAGRCPKCSTLAYVETAKTLAADHADEILKVLKELLEWGRSNTRITMPNSPHEILVRAHNVIEEAEGRL